jgi:hypothetical protein
MTLIRMTMTCLTQALCHPRESVLSVRPVHPRLRVLELQNQFVETSEGDFLALKVTKMQ